MRLISQLLPEMAKGLMAMKKRSWKPTYRYIIFLGLGRQRENRIDEKAQRSKV